MIELTNRDIIIRTTLLISVIYVNIHEGDAEFWSRHINKMYQTFIDQSIWVVTWVFGSLDQPLHRAKCLSAPFWKKKDTSMLILGKKGIHEIGDVMPILMMYESGIMPTCPRNSIK